MKVKSESEVTQLCLTLRDPMGLPPSMIFQARVLEWGAIASPIECLICAKYSADLRDNEHRK